MASSFGSGVASHVQTLIQTIGQALGKDFDFSQTNAFRIVLETNDGRNVVTSAYTLDKGPNPPVSIVGSNSIQTPEGGSADADVSFGTGSLVGSTLDIVVPDPGDGPVPVPDDAILYAVATSVAGNAKSLNVEKINDTTIRVSSLGDAYSGPLEVDTGNGQNSSGTVDITMVDTVVATDLIHVEELTAGGGAADHYSGFRKDADEITVFAHDAAGAVVATNTATVRAIKSSATLNSRNRVAGTLVAGVATLNLTNAVGDRLFVREVTAGGTAANHFVAFRVDNSQVRVHAVQASGALQTANTSSVEVYNVGSVDCANAVLVSGTLDVPMVVAAADRLSVVELAAGGGAANHFSVFRKDADEVTVQAHDAAGALVATNTSTVRVYNHGQSADETSGIAWLVRRQ